MYINSNQLNKTKYYLIITIFEYPIDIIEGFLRNCVTWKTGESSSLLTQVHF